MSNELFDHKKLYIIDGYALIYRSYFALINAPMHDGEGNNVSAVFGFFKTVLKLMREYRPDYLVVALDSKGPTFRHELYSEYKANREKAPEDLHSQVPVIENILDALNIPHIKKQGFEADDIIATLCDEAEKQNIDTVIFTGDKDLLQLVDAHTSALRPAKKGENAYRLFTAREVQEEFGVKPEQIIDYLCLLGDSSDNVPGVAGIGPVGAVKLLKTYPSLKSIYEHLDEQTTSVKTKLEQASSHMELTHTLIALKHDIFTVDSFDTPQFLANDLDYQAASVIFDGLKLPSLVKDVLKMVPEDKQEVKSIKEPKRGTYEAVVSLERLRELLDQALKETEALAFDTETDSLDELKANLLGFSFAWKEGVAYYVPVDDKNRKDIKIILSKYLPHFKIVGQNIKYDYKVLKRLGLTLENLYFDTMIAAWLLDSAGRYFNMDFLADKYLNYKTIHYDDAVPKGKTIADISAQDAANYSGEDSDITWRLYELFKEFLEAQGLMGLMSEVEMPLVKVLSDMELAGIVLDSQKLMVLQKEFGSLMEKSTAQIYAYAGRAFNLNSPSQLQQVLFSELKIPPGAKTQTGFSTSSDVLEPLAGEYPIVKEILQYRFISKLKNTYVDTLPEMIDSATGRIHPHFLQTGTETGRLSCNNPNLQNIPVRSEEGRKIRSAFVAKKGCMFLSADYSQIELVVLSHMSKDVNLRQSFLNGEDIHKSTASLIFSVPQEMVTPEQRRVAKTINFGVVYGISAHSLSLDLGITHAQAKEFIDNYFSKYSQVASYIQEIQRQAEKDGYVKTLLGHVRTIKEIGSSNKTEKAKAQRISVNTVIQGSAADIVKLAMLKVTRAMEQKGLESRLLLQIHDELIFEVPEAEIDQMKVLVKDCMENSCKLSVPLKVGIEIASDWGQIH